jgi:lipoprotein-anchoring transpeptidase ErfK/SrfK
MSEHRTKLRALPLAAAALGLAVVTGGASAAVAGPTIGEAPSTPGSPSAITFSNSATPGTAVAAPAAVPAPAAAPAPRPATQASAPVSLEQRLAELRYDVSDMPSAIMAFQKVNGLERTGQAGPDVVARAQSTTTPPGPLVPNGGPNRVEVDLARQVLFLYEGGALTSILPVSSGSGERFCEGGRCRDAITNVGDFAISRQGQGWETGPLGSLYNPQYFDGGIAIHGAKSVPATPASHGCVRIPMSAADWFPGHVSVGTPVFVR